MVRLTTSVNEEGQLVISRKSAIARFCYEDGYAFLVTDLGKRGVKIELAHEDEGSGAIILPPAKAEECGKWLLQTIGQMKYSPLKELSGILKRVLREKALDRILQRGDKKKIREAVRLLSIQHS